jgi:cell division transport system permease protein
MKTKLKMYCIAHLRANLASLGKILRVPFSSFMTVFIIGIALALPTSLYVMLQNARGLTQSWKSDSSQISVYLKTNLSRIQTQDILHQLRVNPEIANVTYISPEQGLKEFGKALGSEKVIGSLHRNPLPGLILVQPILSLRSPMAITHLLDTIKKFPEADTVQLNLAWLQKLQNIINLAQHIIYALGLLLALGIMLIVGNAMRLATQNERQEITILKLVGATNRFIRRPFLHAGIWYGLFGGIIAWIMVTVILRWLQMPVAKLASAYNSNFYLHSLNISSGICLLLISMALGLIGSWAMVRE